MEVELRLRGMPSSINILFECILWVSDLDWCMWVVLQPLPLTCLLSRVQLFLPRSPYAHSDLLHSRCQCLRVLASYALIHLSFAAPNMLPTACRTQSLTA